jgi:hypothetical protein
VSLSVASVMLLAGESKAKIKIKSEQKITKRNQIEKNIKPYGS